MQKNHLIIAVVAIVLLAIAGALLFGNVQKTVEDAENLVDESMANVTNETIRGNVSDVSVNASEDYEWLWSGQQEDFFKQYVDANGNSHTVFKSGGDHFEFKVDGSIYLNGVNITDQFK